MLLMRHRKRLGTALYFILFFIIYLIIFIKHVEKFHIFSVGTVLCDYLINNFERHLKTKSLIVCVKNIIMYFR